MGRQGVHESAGPDGAAGDGQYARMARGRDSRRRTGTAPRARSRSCTARSPAAANLNGVRVMSKDEVAKCSIEQSCGPDALLIINTRFSLGFMMSQPGSSLGPNPKSFGHPGAGGSLGYADPEAKIGFGYTMNKMQSGFLIDPRATALIEALYASM